MQANKQSNEKIDIQLSFGWTKRAQRYLFLVSLGILLMSALLLMQAYRVEKRTPKPQPKAVSAQGFAIGQKIAMGTSEVTVDSVTYTDGSDHFKAPSGSRYAIVSISITNPSDTPFNMLPANDTYVKSEAGDLAYLSPVGLDVPYRAGEILHGETIKGQLSYLVNSNTHYAFFVDASWSGGVMKFMLPESVKH